MINTWLMSEGKIQNNSKVAVESHRRRLGVDIINDKVKNRLKFYFSFRILQFQMYNTQNVKMAV